MGVKVAFIGESNRFCKGKGVGYTGEFLRLKEQFWNSNLQLNAYEPVLLSTVLDDLGYNVEEMMKLMPYMEESIRNGAWTNGDVIDFGMTFDQNGHFLLNFNCKMIEGANNMETMKSQDNKKRCYYWKTYKYHVSADQISLKGWAEWCNELFQIQHNTPRPQNKRIYINPNMDTATVKARFWNKDKIEKWLNDHGYKWTMTSETTYQFPFANPDEVELIDSDAELKARHRKAG